MLFSAKHIKSALKLANVDEQQMRASGKWQTQLLYNAQRQEGVFAMFASVMSAQSELPAYLHFQLDTHINDQLQISWTKLYALQQGAEQWYRNVAKQFFANQQRMGGGPQTRAQRVGQQNSSQKLQRIYDTLGISSRRGPAAYLQNWQNRNFNAGNDRFSVFKQHNLPFAMFAFRTKDVDQAFVALDEHIMSQQTSKMLKGEQPISIVRLLFGEQYQKQQKLNIAVAHNLNEEEAKVPTSVGVPLHILSSAPTLVSIDGHLKAEMETANLYAPLGTSVNFNGKATARVAHIQKMVGE